MIATSLIEYSLGRTVDRAEIYYSNGHVRLGEGPVDFSLGFRVDEDRRDNSALLEANLEQWQSVGAVPTTFEVDGTTGYWHEERLTADDGVDEPGTARFYVLAKGAVTVTLTAFAPEGVDMTDEARDTADALIQSVRIDESTLTATSSDQQMKPTVPFTFEPPPSLAGPGEAELASVYWARYELDGLPIEVKLQRREDAADYYAGQAADLAGTEAEARDVKATSPTDATIGRLVDEGLGTAPRQDDGTALMYFLLRKGDQIIEIRSSGAGQPLPQSVQDVVTSVLTTMNFT